MWAWACAMCQKHPHPHLASRPLVFRPPNRPLVYALALAGPTRMPMPCVRLRLRPRAACCSCPPVLSPSCASCSCLSCSVRRRTLGARSTRPAFRRVRVRALRPLFQILHATRRSWFWFWVAVAAGSSSIPGRVLRVCVCTTTFIRNSQY